MKLPWHDRLTYSDVVFTARCSQCGKEFSEVLPPANLKKFLEGKLDSEEAFDNLIKDEDAFLMVFKICTTCNGGYQIEDIDAYPGKEE